jgi:hypothetical protein
VSDGGPAFPSGETRYRDGIGGMSLRDYFAAQAMSGMLANRNFQWDLSPSFTPDENLARRAFAVADAMLEARK